MAGRTLEHSVRCPYDCTELVGCILAEVPSFGGFQPLLFVQLPRFSRAGVWLSHTKGEPAPREPRWAPARLRGLRGWK